jgi:hypothetical protein
VAEPPAPGQGGGGGGGLAGLLQSLSQGVRDLLVVSEKLAALRTEDDRARKAIEDLQGHVHRMLGTLTEMDKRVAERFAEYDKRLADTDKRVQLQIELAVRNALDKQSAKG